MRSSYRPSMMPSESTIASVTLGISTDLPMSKGSMPMETTVCHPPSNRILP